MLFWPLGSLQTPTRLAQLGIGVLHLQWQSCDHFLVLYYQRFVQGFARYAAPLHKLVAKLQPHPKRNRTGRTVSLQDHWDWGCDQAFNTLRDKLISAPVLGYADLSKPFILEVDASGLGLVLSQEQDEGPRRPVAYASRGLQPTEQNMDNYSAMKLELLALKWAVTDKFRDYLLGTKFTVLTDNNSLADS